ncbi:hypothetical protein Pelo_8780 [Pelomyxa schiedti]|nr:hypothetical protein Pelo_8780 [Pelomyxa schiedti]
MALSCYKNTVQFFSTVVPPLHPLWVGLGEGRMTGCPSPHSPLLNNFLERFFTNLATSNCLSPDMLVFACLLAERAVLAPLPQLPPESPVFQSPTTTNVAAIQRDLAVASVVVSAKILDDCFGPEEFIRIAQAARLSRADVLSMETTFLSRWLSFDLWVDPMEFSLFSDRLEQSGWSFRLPIPPSPSPSGLIRSPSSYPRSFVEELNSPSALPPLHLSQKSDASKAFSGIGHTPSYRDHTSTRVCTVSTNPQHSLGVFCKVYSNPPSPSGLYPLPATSPHLKHSPRCSHSSPQLIAHVSPHTSPRNNTSQILGPEHFSASAFRPIPQSLNSSGYLSPSFHDIRMKSPSASPTLSRSSSSSSCSPSLSPRRISPPQSPSPPIPSPRSVLSSSLPSRHQKMLPPPRTSPGMQSITTILNLWPDLPPPESRQQVQHTTCSGPKPTEHSMVLPSIQKAHSNNVPKLHLESTHKFSSNYLITDAADFPPPWDPSVLQTHNQSPPPSPSKVSFHHTQIHTHINSSSTSTSINTNTSSTNNRNNRTTTITSLLPLIPITTSPTRITTTAIADNILQPDSTDRVSTPSPSPSPSPTTTSTSTTTTSSSKLLSVHKNNSTTQLLLPEPHPEPRKRSRSRSSQQPSAPAHDPLRVLHSSRSVESGLALLVGGRMGDSI